MDLKSFKKIFAIIQNKKFLTNELFMSFIGRLNCMKKKYF